MNITLQVPGFFWQLDLFTFWLTTILVNFVKLPFSSLMFNKFLRWFYTMAIRFCNYIIAGCLRLFWLYSWVGDLQQQCYKEFTQTVMLLLLLAGVKTFKKHLMVTMCSNATYWVWVLTSSTSLCHVSLVRSSWWSRPSASSLGILSARS